MDSINKNQTEEIKNELLFVLQILHKNNFLIYELYEGNKITPDDFLKKMIYF